MSSRPLRIAIVGAGPGGTFLARLLRLRMPQAHVEVVERDAPDAPYGFGVVFGERALASLERADPSVHAALLDAGVRWERTELRHQGGSVSWAGFGMVAIARQHLLRVLHEAAVKAGASIAFDREVDPWDLTDVDLVVGADGLNSRTRDRDRSRFGTSYLEGQARYIWLGADVAFDGMTFAFASNEHGDFAAHAYPYAPDESTFLVETDEATWRRAGFAETSEDEAPAGASDERAVAYLQDVFADVLGGASLVGSGSRWALFRTIRNRRWSSGGRVLLGDAAHTAHFSLGAGTRLAMDDAVALADAIAQSASVDDAFARYEGERAPAVRRLQAYAEPSRRWWESFGSRLDLSPERLAFSYLSRTGVVGYDSMASRDPAFVAEVERSVSRAALSEPILVEVDMGDADVPSDTDAFVGMVSALVAGQRDGAVRLVDRRGPRSLLGTLEHAERIRRELGLTVIVAAPCSADRARTAVLSGRCDRVDTLPRSRFLDDMQRSMEHLEEAATQAADDPASADPDGDAWSVAEILGHVEEMLRYWSEQALELSMRDEDGLPVGRVAVDRARVEAVRHARGRSNDDGIRAAWTALADADGRLLRIADDGWSRTGVHAHRGELKVHELVTTFLVDHLDEHARQAWTVVRER